MSSKADRSKIPEQHHVSFNLQPNDFQPKRTAIASHQGASAFRNLFHAWFNVSFLSIKFVYFRRNYEMH